MGHDMTNYRNILGPVFVSSCLTIATFHFCCDMLNIENMEPGKQIQHHTASTNVAWKIWPFSIHFRNSLQQSSQRRATCCAHQCCDMLHWNAAIVWPWFWEVNKSSIKILLTYNEMLQLCSHKCKTKSMDQHIQYDHILSEKEQYQ